MRREHSSHFHNASPALRVPPALDALITKSLQKKPEDRFRDMVEVHAALKEAQTAAAAGWLARAGASAFRNCSARIAAVALLILFAVVLGLRQLMTRVSTDEAATAAPAPPLLSASDLSREAAAFLERHDKDGNVDRAISLLEQALQLDRNYATAYAHLAEGYRQKHRATPDPQ